MYVCEKTITFFDEKQRAFILVTVIVNAMKREVVIRFLAMKNE